MADYTLSAKITGDSSSFEKSMDNVKTAVSETQNKLSTYSDKVTAIGTSVKSVGTKMTTSLTVPIAAVGTVAGKMSLDFEDALAKVSTIADTTEVSMEDLGASITNLSDETGIAASDIAENVYNAISAGQSTGDAVAFVENATKLAKAGFTESADALDVLTTIMNAYGMEAEDVSKVSDVLIQTQNLGKTTVDELSSSMGKIIPTANASNVSLEQVASGYAIMTANGIATAETTTYMNSMLNELSTTGSTSADVLKNKTGKSFSELMDEGYSLADVLEIVNEGAEEQSLQFSDMFSSSEAAKAGLVLLGDGADSFNDTLAEMQNSSGSTDTAFEKMQTTSNELGIMWNQIKNTLIDLGDSIMNVLLPIIESAKSSIESFTQWFTNLDDSTKEMIVKIGLFVAALGPVLAIVGQVIIFIGSVVNAFSILKTMLTAIQISNIAVGTSFSFALGPVLLIIAAVALLVAGFMYLWKTNDGFREAVISAWENIKSVITAVMSGVMSVLSSTWDAIVCIVKSAIDALTPIIEVIKTVVSVVFSGILNYITTVWNVISTVISTAIEVVKSVISATKPAAELVFGGICNYIKTVWDVITGIISGLTSVVSTVFNTIYNTTSSIMTKVKSAFTTAFNSIKSAWSGLTGIVSGIFSGISSSVSTLVNQVKGFVNGVIGGVNSAVSLINKIPGVSIGSIPYLLHGTDDWQGGFARMNEGGRGELTYLPNGTQVIPHDISMKYARESAKANAGASSGGVFDYDTLINGIAKAMSNVTMSTSVELDGQTVGNAMTPFINQGLGNLNSMAVRGV